MAGGRTEASGPRRDAEERGARPTKLAFKVTLAAILGSLAVLAVDAAIGVEHEVEQFGAPTGSTTPSPSACCSIRGRPS